MLLADDLRKSILQYAIQGKLVPQDPNDEPAEVLYAKIQTEKQKLIKEGKIKKEKTLPPITDDEVPFDIPSNWKWVRIGEIFAHNTGKALNSSKQTGKLKKYITTSNVYWNYFKLDEIREMYFNDDEIQKCSVTKGDLLVCEGGDFGRAAIWNYDYDMCIQNHIHRLKVYSTVCTMFFYYIFFLYKMSGYIGGKGIGIQGLSSGALHNIIVPLPPLAEQKRIVKKIEELEPLIKRYSEAETELSALNESFPEQLKKSILQHAIQGKLVEQNPNDEPAEVLYAKIQTEKQKLIKEGKIKKDKPLPPITDDEIPFDIPTAWKWTKLGELIQLISGQDMPPDKYNSTRHGIPYITGASNIENNNVIINRWSEFPKAKAYKGDLLLTCKGTIGTMAFLCEDEVHIARQIMAIRPLGNILDIKYIRTFLEAFVLQIKSNARSLIPGISRDDILELYFPLPPLAEQKRIVKKLDKLLSMIDNLKVG